MSNLFQDILNDKGSLNVLSNDINKLIQYVELLVSGKNNTLGLDMNFLEYNHGTISNLKPFGIFEPFLSSIPSTSQKITMENVDINNNNSSESHYVTLVNVNDNNDNGNFSDKKKEAFTSYNLFESEEFPFPIDLFDQMYFAGLGGLGIYILYRFMKKSK